MSVDYIIKKWNHAGFQKYLKNTGWMFGGRMFNLCLSFFVGVYIARYLGPSNYGLLNYAISFVGLFSFLSSFGIEGIVSREIIKNNTPKDVLLGTSFFIKLFGSFVAITTIVIVSLLTTKDSFTLILIFLFSLSYIPQAFNVIETYFQSQVLSKNIVKAQFISALISTILKLCVIFLNKGVFWLLSIYIVETTLFALFLLIAFRKNGNYFTHWRFNKKIALNLLKDSWPLMLSSIAIGIYMKIDQVMIKSILGNEQVGIYAVAVKLSEAWYFVPMIITASLSPAIIKAKEISIELFNNRLSKLYFLMFWLSTSIALITTVLAYPIIKILFGNQYLAASTTLQIYVWAGIAVSLGVAVGQYILANNLMKITLYNTLLGAGINVVLNIILIPQMGINGAAIATLISYTLSTSGIFIFSKTRKHGLLMLKSILPHKHHE